MRGVRRDLRAVRSSATRLSRLSKVTHRLASVCRNPNLVLSTEPEQPRVLRNLAQELQAVKRGVLGRFSGLFRAWFGRVHHLVQEAELVADA